MPETTLAEKISRARSLPGKGSAAPFGGARTIPHLLAERVHTGGDAPFLIYYDGDGRRSAYSYAEFDELVGRTASLLLREGISRGDRIATVAHNHPDTVVQYFAAFAIGAVVVPINTGEDDRRIGYILGHSQSKLAFVREEYAGRIAHILEGVEGRPRIVAVSANPDAAGGFHARIRECPRGAFPRVEPSDEALIVYTSGTTGNPKGVVLTQENLLVDAAAIAAWHGIGEGDRMMCVLPIHHVNGTVVTLVTPLHAGGSVVLQRKFHSGSFFRCIEREGVHVVSVVPTLLQFLLHEHPDGPLPPRGDLRHIICGAGPLTVELASKFEDRFGIPIVHGYGLSETTCYSCFLPPDLPPAEHRKWLSAHGFPSIGVAIPPNEMAIHDERGIEAADGVRGEIVIRGYNVMKEYYGNAGANAQAFAHGWFRSGDEGFAMTAEDGRRYFFITGRLKELIIRGGVNISPFEIDEVLMTMPGVKAGLAVGFENDWYGEEVGAYVQVHDGAIIPAQAVLDYCRRFMPFQKSPKVVVFGNDIPVTSTGKYQRNRLKPLFAGWKGEQFTEKRS